MAINLGLIFLPLALVLSNNAAFRISLSWVTAHTPGWPCSLQGFFELFPGSFQFHIVGLYFFMTAYALFVECKLTNSYKSIDWGYHQASNGLFHHLRKLEPSVSISSLLMFIILRYRFKDSRWLECLFSHQTWEFDVNRIPEYLDFPHMLCYFCSNSKFKKE
jgi:hypothetical protein